MRIGEIFTASVERLGTGGAGVLHYQGQRVFIDNTAPGDVIIGRIREDRKNWALADLLEIIEPGPNRISPICPQYGVCGGCSLQHLDYPCQLAEKSAVLQDRLLRIGGLSVLPKLTVYGSQPFEYRNRVQFHRIQSPRQDQSALGFKARKGDAVIPLTDCPIADPGIRLALREKQLALPLEKDRFTVYARGQTFLSEAGTRRGTVSLHNREFFLDPGVFFQSNGSMLEKVIQDLLEFVKSLDPELPAADLYCGVGVFAGFLQTHFSKITLVEQNKTALTLARENVRSKAIQYAPISTDQWVKTLAGKDSMLYGFIIADPPRQGLSPLLCSQLAQAGPPALAYLSCDPSALARDARALTKGGYTLTDLRLYDFYPQTPHIETLALFEREGIHYVYS
ncbi:MAG: methyltransferase [Treponema sp.]|jgi:23S rRNA (uracil1939-C5)-methyltransferase|nr:methyltransferase [Treponema sp.]